MGTIIRNLGLDPLGIFSRAFQLPERRFRLKPVYKEATGVKGRIAVGRRCRHKDDLIARFQTTIAVNNQGFFQGPAAVGFGLDLC